MKTNLHSVTRYDPSDGDETVFDRFLHLFVLFHKVSLTECRHNVVAVLRSASIFAYVSI